MLPRDFKISPGGGGGATLTVRLTVEQTLFSDDFPKEIQSEINELESESKISA